MPIRIGTPGVWPPSTTAQAFVSVVDTRLPAAAPPGIGEASRGVGEPNYHGWRVDSASTSKPIKGRLRRVRKNLRLGMALAWSASPRLLIRYTLLGIVSAALAPVTVVLGAMLVNRIA